MQEVSPVNMRLSISWWGAKCSSRMSSNSMTIRWRIWHTWSCCKEKRRLKKRCCVNRQISARAMYHLTPDTTKWSVATTPTLLHSPTKNTNSQAVTLSHWRTKMALQWMTWGVPSQLRSKSSCKCTWPCIINDHPLLSWMTMTTNP